MNTLAGDAGPSPVAVDSVDGGSERERLSMMDAVMATSPGFLAILWC